VTLAAQSCGLVKGWEENGLRGRFLWKKKVGIFCSEAYSWGFFEWRATGDMGKVVKG